MSSNPAVTGLPTSTPPIPLFVGTIQYQGNPLVLTAFNYPWGIAFPPVPPEPVQIVPAEKRGSWNGVDVSVASDEKTVVLGPLNAAQTLPLSNIVYLPSTSSSTTLPLSQTVSTPASVTESDATPASSKTPLSASTGESSPLPTSLSQSSSSGVKPAAAAGIAIGCFISGALIAALVAWLCLGKKGKQRARDQEASAVALIGREKGASAQVLSVASVSPISQAAESALPQPLEDKAISGEISKISNSIKNHVQSFYHNGAVSPGVLDLDDLRGLGDDLPMSTGTLSTLLGNADTREIALRFCIAWVAVARMQLSALPSTTFLPPEIAECFLSMAFVSGKSQVQSAYLSKWRVITAELMQSSYVRNPFTAVDPRSQNIQSAMNVLEGILQSYTDPRVDNNQRRRNLEEILKRVAIFAFTLFSQPSSWRFDWQDEEVFKSGSLCVFPALIQVTDESGNTVKPPRPFSDAVIRRLDE